MSDLGDLLRARAALRPVSPPVTSEPPSGRIYIPDGSVFARPPAVRDSEDLQRIVALPRRPQEPVNPEELAQLWTEKLKRPSGTWSLWPIQAFALAEAEATGGLLAPISVGCGKTLTSLLLPMVLGARVTVLLVPPQLKAQLLQRNYPVLADHWKIPNLVGASKLYPDVDQILHVVSYTELQSMKRGDVLERIKPDLVVADEVHCIARHSSVRTRRFKDYFKRYPATKFCGLSGTITNRSIKEYAHLARLALKSGSPLPLHWPTLEEWSFALDASELPAEPGELLRLCRPGEPVRSGFRRRLVETPGVVVSGDNELGFSLIISDRRPKIPKSVEDALALLRSKWVTPGGEYMTDVLMMSAHAREIACGFYYRWIWPNGEPKAIQDEWKEARKEWHREVRQFLANRARPGLDSPGLIAAAAALGRIPSAAWPRWAEIKNKAKPQTEAVWLDDFLVDDAIEWGLKNTGIVWYDHAALGEKIATKSGFKLYGGGKKASAEIIEEDGSRTIVASIDSHHFGKNLQMFHRNLVTFPPSSGKILEQLLGRCHREGQQNDEVEYCLYQHTSEMEAALESALRDTWYTDETLGARRKLTYASFTFNIASGVAHAA
jgi:hypothetical protein